jgi:hypothetical protein
MRVVELDAVGLDVDAAVEASAGAAGDAFEDARPQRRLPRRHDHERWVEPDPAG